MSHDRSQTAYTESAAGLARRALDALRGAGGTALVAAHVEKSADPKSALAAIRVVGADIFAPCLLADTVFHPQDAAAVAQSFSVFPPSGLAPAPPPGGAAPPWVAAWRDWATAELLARHTDAGPAPVRLPRPAGPSGPAAHPARASDDGWQRWSVRMAQLSPLALPGLDGPVHEAARAAPLALARGATRAALRRDLPTAARIVRWLALLRSEGAVLPLDPEPLVAHLGFVGGDPRPALDAAIARQLLRMEPA